MIATKEQERKALEQIRQIVEGLGSDSYVAMAFNGCFEMAEENIENDWGISFPDKIENLEKEYLRRLDLLEAGKKELEQENENLRQENENLRQENKGLNEEYDFYISESEQFERTINEARKQKKQLEASCASLHQELLVCKALLFDLMYKKEAENLEK